MLLIFAVLFLSIMRINLRGKRNLLVKTLEGFILEQILRIKLYNVIDKIKSEPVAFFSYQLSSYLNISIVIKGKK